MPTLSLTLSVAASNELTDAFSVGYLVTIDGQPNPETRAQFARRMVIALLKQHVLLYRKRMAAATAAATDPDIT